MSIVFQSVCLGAVIVCSISIVRCASIYLRVARRCSKYLPSENDWTEVLDLDLKTTTALTVTEFIPRSKLDPKLGVSSKIRAERDKQYEKKNHCLWKF